MAARILIAECKQEVSTFNPVLSDYDDFMIYRGAELVDAYRGTRAEVGGALAVFDADSAVELVPTYGACFKTSGGTLARPAWERIRDEFVAAIAAAPPVDAVYLSMHGAMASEEEEDPEGYLLAEIRRVLGDAIPVVVSLDLHGIVTDRMFMLSDAVVGFHTYPHVDFFETGERAAKLLRRIMRGEVKPVTARVSIPVLVRGDELITATGKIGNTIRLAQSFEREADGLSAGIFIGNPFTDVPELQSYTFAVTNGDRVHAELTARKMANTLWADHETMRVSLQSLNQMVAQLEGLHDGTTGLVDAADATSSGASGDSNAIMAKLIDANYAGTVLAPLVDAPAVERAFALGVGAEAEFELGGTLDRQRFRPLKLNCRVRLLADGKVRSESFDSVRDSGPTVVLESGNFTFVIGSRPVHLFDRSFFWGHGQNPTDFRAVVIKSPHCQPHMYADWCRAMINVDAPGSTSANLPSLGHTRCPRPMFPLDSEVRFTPAVKIYRRGVNS